MVETKLHHGDQYGRNYYNASTTEINVVETIPVSVAVADGCARLQLIRWSKV